MLMSSLERRFDEFERSTDVRVRQIEDFLTRSQRDTQGRIFPNVKKNIQYKKFATFYSGYRKQRSHARSQRGLGKSPG